MDDRIVVVKWNRSKGERGPTAVGESETKMGDYAGKNGETYKCLGVYPEGPLTVAEFERVDKSKEFPS